MSAYRLQHDQPISRNMFATYFFVAAIGGAGFQLGMLGIRKIVDSISKSSLSDIGYWSDLIKFIQNKIDFSSNYSSIKDDTNVKVEKEEGNKKESSEENAVTKIFTNALAPENEKLETDNKRNRSLSLGSNSSVTNISQEASVAQGSEKRYLEMLIHNVAHTDLVFSIGDSSPTQSVSTSVDDSNGTIESDSDESGTGKLVDLTLCRPRFSAFSLFTKRVLSSLLEKSKESNLSFISFPRYERKYSPRYTLVTPRPSRQISSPVGFNLTDPSHTKNLGLSNNDLISLRLRGRDYAKIPELDGIMKSHQQCLEVERANEYTKVESKTALQSKTSLKESKYSINAIFFPLVATLMARWEESMKQKFSSRHSVKKVIVLVSGVGTPRNWTHSISGNSTKSCAEVMELFLNILYPDVTVVKVHSERNIFRYDENILFTKRELVPVIDSYRDAHSRNLPYPDEVIVHSDDTTSIQTYQKNHPFNPDWKKTFHVTLSFADGAPARTYAIQAALRSYRPTYFHVWQLKTFWHETKITSDDIEVHAFEEMETTPPVDIDNATDSVQLVTNEILKFKSEYERKFLKEENDIDKFWLRKTKKPVLAVLAVRDPKTNKIIMYRGTNMEVSMPTGSLCAERNVIGTALATDPSLKREDLIMVAVLAIPFEDINENLRNQNGQNLIESEEKVMDKSNSREGVKRSLSISSFASIVEEETLSDEDEDWIRTIGKEENSPSIGDKVGSGEYVDMDLSSSIVKIPPLNLEPPTTIPPITPLRRIRIFSNNTENSEGGKNITKQVGKEKENSGPSKKQLIVRNKSNKQSLGRRTKRKTVVVHSHSDINPLKPCGACNEWLKKIAESNPYFRVLTFTDAQCKGVYVSECQE